MPASATGDELGTCLSHASTKYLVVFSGSGSGTDMISGTPWLEWHSPSSKSTPTTGGEEGKSFSRVSRSDPESKDSFVTAASFAKPLLDGSQLPQPA